jgi:HD-GYP domain-containing protein (c-di-GMP phosphodiesterase class II)
MVANILADLFPIIYSIDASENKAEITLTFAINFAIALLFSPLVAMISVLITDTISQIITKKEWFKTLFNSSKIGLETGIPSLFFYKYYSLSLPLTNPKNLAAIAVGFVIYLLLDSVALFGLLSVLNNKPFFNFWYKNMKKVFFTLLALFFLGLVIIFFFQTQPLMNLFIVPTFIAVYFALKRDVQVTQETEQALYTLAAVVDARIPDTMFHSDRVAKITRDLCDALNVDDDVANVVVMSAKLHDIGKIAIPDRILQKNTKLTADEYETVKLHPIDGANIAGSLTRFRKGATLIRHHHERYDGNGYPDKIKDEQIPLGSKIIAVVDSFDTMTTPRNYKKIPRTIDEALGEIEINKGTQFDPHISDVFIRMVEENKQKYQNMIDEARSKIEVWLSQQPQ